MKEKVIEVVGRTWRALGEKGETTARDIAKFLKEDEDVVNQAIGWLAREDKIKYAKKQNQVFVSLIESELNAFKSISKQAVAQATQPQEKKKRILKLL